MMVHLAGPQAPWRQDLADWLATDRVVVPGAARGDWRESIRRADLVVVYLDPGSPADLAEAAIEAHYAASCHRPVVAILVRDLAAGPRLAECLAHRVDAPEQAVSLIRRRYLQELAIP